MPQSYKYNLSFTFSSLSLSLISPINSMHARAARIVINLLLQEVQFSHMYQIQNRLNRMNYEMIFKKRTGDKVSSTL